jgi:hypothetical protein
VLDYAVDWGTEYLEGDAIAESAWSVRPDEPGGVIVASSSFDAESATVTASGGLSGRVYQLSNQVVFVSGRADTRSVVLRVEER